MMSPVARTSRWIAAARAREAECAKPLFADPFAADLAGVEGFKLFDATQETRPLPRNDGPDPYLSIRTRFLDDGLLAVMRDHSLRQIVLLAAGMDARAFRLAFPPGTTVFEIDRADVFQHKEPILRERNAVPACDRRVVTADLEHDWVPRLRAAGFDGRQPAAFLVEGLLMYLDGTAVDSLLQTLESVAQPGSWLGGDLVGSDLLMTARLKPFLGVLEGLGCPWRFGTPDPYQMLALYGWEATIAQAGDPEANYGRWPYEITPREVPGLPRVYLFTARRFGA